MAAYGDLHLPSMANMRTPEDGDPVLDPVTARAGGQLAAILPSIGGDDRAGASIRAVLDRLTAHRPPASAYRAPRWSGVGDDCSPLEWSLAFHGDAVDLRLLVEAQSEPADPCGYWEAGRALTRSLVDDLGAATGRLDEIEDLYAPGPGATPAFVLWHGLEWRHPAGERPPRVKLYLNPAAADPAPDAVIEVVAETYRRLGFGDSWPVIASLLDEAAPSHVSIDLDGSAGARFKVYLRVRDVGAAARAYGLGSRAQPDDVIRFVGALAGREVGPEDRLPRPGSVVLHHTDTAATTPERTVLNLHVPSLCGDDRTALDRIGPLLAAHGLAADRHADALAALARDSFMGTSPFRAAGPDPLGGQSRLQSYMSFQREPEGARLTAYVGLRAFAARFGWRADDPDTMWPSAVARGPGGPGGPADPADQMPAP